MSASVVSVARAPRVCECGHLEDVHHGGKCGFGIAIDWKRRYRRCTCSRFVAVPAPESELCADTRRIDGRHSWRFDGDDPYVVCVYCGERRDALTGASVVARSGGSAGEEER
jgi:hypothetical protein